MRDWFPYGLDAPPVVRNLALAALAGWILFAFAVAGTLPVWVQFFGYPAIGFTLGAVSMLWGSRFGKVRRRERLLDRLPWRGDECVLDLGCGRGLLAVGAARRVPRGRVIGVDIWQAEDLSGNRPEAVAANARREGVDAHVEVRTADMRQLPLDDASIDAVVSMTAIHNIYQPAGRERALDEAVRVLKPGGCILIDDIRHLAQYAARLRGAGCEVRVTRGPGQWWTRLTTFGNLAPGTLVGRKPPV